MRVVAMLLAAVVAASCGKKADQTDQVANVRVAPVNALVPKSLGDKLVFEERKLKDGPYIYVVAGPKGWTGPMGMMLGPPDQTATSFRVSYRCESEPCKAMDWNAKIDEALADFLQKSKAERNERGKNGRVITALDPDGMKTLIVAKWADGADGYLWCEVHLDKPWSDAVAAFEQACQNANVTDSGGFSVL